MDESVPEDAEVANNAGVWLRLVARIIDGIVLVIPTLILVAPLGGGFYIGGGNNTGKRFVASVLGTALSYGYFVLLEGGSWGATLGKRALGLHVDNAQEVRTYDSCARRNLWMLAGILPTGLGGLINLGLAIAIGVTASNDRLGQGFHDRFAGLRVTRAKG